MTGDSSPASTGTEQETARIDEFLSRFFGPGNDAGRYPAIIEPFIQNLRRGDGTPAVLPRFMKDSDGFALYVIPSGPSGVTPTADLIEAFAGPTYCSRGDTTPAELDPSDPVDAAVIDFAGAGRTFVVQASSNAGQRARLRGALALMQHTVASRPTRLWHVAKPFGRLLAEFEASLSAGGEAASQAVLDQLSAQGGITATNLAYLRIKRLDSLGRSEDLLSMPGLAEVMRQDPPLPVKEAVLNAIYSTTLEEPLQLGNVAAACALLRDAGRPLPVPAHDPVTLYGDEAAVVLITAAVGRRDKPALETMAAAMLDSGRTGSRAPSALGGGGQPSPAVRPPGSRHGR